jgi:hypothetical protein
MSKKIINMVAVELSEQEIDNVAGGVDIVISDIKGSISQAINEFFQKELPVVQPIPPVVLSL